MNGRKEVPQKNKDKRKIRPELIIIFNQGEGSYGIILRRVKADPKLTNLGDNVSCCRWMVKKSKDITANKPLSQIGNFLGHEIEIGSSRPQISIVRKDTDEVSTKKEVREAFKIQVG